MANIKVRINNQIRSRELRVIGDNGDNYGIMTFEDAMQKAQDLGLDLIEISPNANPPVAKITDFGKYQYDEKKKEKSTKTKAHQTEVKNLQVKIGTGEHDLELKAKRASEWLAEGNRIKLDLYLVGRSKEMKMDFLKERLERILKLITVEYNVAEQPQKGPKGVTMVIEKKR